MAAVLAAAAAAASVARAKTALPGVVRFGVIAPLRTSKTEESLGAILPSVDLAAKAIAQPNGKLPGWNITIEYRNGNCSSTDGPLKAFELHDICGECAGSGDCARDKPIRPKFPDRNDRNSLTTISTVRIFFLRNRPPPPLAVFATEKTPVGLTTCQSFDGVGRLCAKV